MRTHGILAILSLTGALLGPLSNRACAQSDPLTEPPDLLNLLRSYTARGQWDVSGNESVPSPLPLGPDRPDQGGAFGAVEFMFMSGNRNIGHQDIGFRGFLDSDGSVSGTPGTYIGSHRIAIDTDSFGPTSWSPGVRMTVGYRLADGSSFSISYLHLMQAVYNTSAGPIPVDFNTGPSGADSFLFAPVFGFSPQFSGPPNKLATASGQIIGSGGSPYGIWNGANTMDIKYTQRFDNWDLTYRSPVLETDYAASFALAGGRFSWIYERFGWNTASSDYTGNFGPQDVANYVNIMSQRMYGPFMGMGNEIYLGSAWSLSGEISTGALFAIVKEKASYVLGDESTGSKRATDQFTFVPNVNATVNLSWFPLSNVQIRVGYNFWSFFNTYYMSQPVGYDAGAPDPSYNHRAIRFFQGLNMGFSLTF